MKTPDATAHPRSAPADPDEVRALIGLNPASFAHPLDRSTMRALQRFPLAGRAANKMISWRHERKGHVRHSASSIRVTNKQLPRLHEHLTNASRILDMEAPELYVSAEQGRNAYTTGHNAPYIVLHSEVVDAMSDDELRAVIAHELGHIKCKHVLYLEMASWVETGLRGAQLVPGTSALFAGVGLRAFISALTRWNQKAELSADRAAMLVVQDQMTCIRMILKLSGAPLRYADEVDVHEYLQQAGHLSEMTSTSVLAKYFRDRFASSASHPLNVERAMQLHEWIETGGYARVLAAPGSVNTSA